MIFASDNWAGAHPAISASLSDNASGFTAAYGNGDLDKIVEKRFCEIFERDVAVMFVGTGTAANSLSLASVAKPGGIVFAHREAHIIVDECSAPEFLSGGLRLHPVDGPGSKMTPAALDAAVAHFAPEIVHDGRPVAISLTQATEAGTVHTLDEIEALTAIAKRYGLPAHMDGARFANALVALDATPAEMTWKRGIDLLSFGGTKNGCWCAEAVVLFDPSAAKDFGFLRKRAAHLFSKSRFIAAQFDAYLRDDLWLETARHANAMAGRLRVAISASNRTRLAWDSEANEVFAILPRTLAESARQDGAVFYDWHTPAELVGSIQPDEVVCRFVTSFATSVDDVTAFASLIRE
ncbi:MAG: low specificity L-threonine aldolase [Rhizobiaceae bacterium]